MSLDVGRAPRGHQDFIDFDLTMRAAMLQAHDTARGAHPDACDLASGEQFDPIADDRALDDRGCVAVLARQDLRQGLQQPYLRAEAPERLRQLASDRPRADHREPPRQLGQRENRFVGKKPGFGEARNRRRGRTRAGRDQRAAEVEPHALNFGRIASDESRLRREKRRRRDP